MCRGERSGDGENRNEQVEEDDTAQFEEVIPTVEVEVGDEDEEKEESNHVTSCNLQPEIPEFNITWNNTIQEVTSNNDIDETLLSGSTDVMSLFCEREDTCDSDEDEEVDEEESEAEVEEVPERIDAEEMARKTRLKFSISCKR